MQSVDSRLTGFMLPDSTEQRVSPVIRVITGRSHRSTARCRSAWRVHGASVAGLRYRRDRPIFLVVFLGCCKHMTLWAIRDIADPDPHVMKQAVWKAHGNGESERGLNQPQGKNVAIATEHVAEDQTADET